MTDGLLALSELNRARQKYRPEVVQWLLVAESPPEIGSGRFFYFEDVSKGDSLFWQTIKTIYPNECDPRISPPRGEKRSFLHRFREDGFYLIDAVEKPIGKATHTVKCRRIRDSLPRLLDDLRTTCSAETNIVLVSSPVYEVCVGPVRAAGYNVANEGMIDFPGSGCQLKFRKKFGRVLQFNKENRSR